MTFLYFAYGSNLWLPRMQERCPSATVVGVGSVAGLAVAYRKPGVDGTAKLDLVDRLDGAVHGAVYEIAAGESDLLDAAEPGYDRLEVEAMGGACRTYRWPGAPTSADPAPWYVDLAVAGARSHGLPEAYIAAALLPAGHQPAE